MKNANWSLGTPILANIMTEMLFTRKYGTPSAKYSVGTHHQGLLFVVFVFVQRFFYVDDIVGHLLQLENDIHVVHTY